MGERLIANNKGIEIGNVKIPALFFADDMAILAQNEADMNEQLGTLITFCEERKLEVNYKKTQIMKVRDNSKENWKIRDKDGIQELEIVDTFKYLGIQIGNNRNIYREQERSSISKLKRNVFVGITKLKAKGSFNKFEVAEALWDYVCINGTLYGAETVVYTEETIKKMEVLQNQLASWILGANRGTAIEALRGELGWETMRTIIYRRKLNYVNRIRELLSGSWTYKVYENLMLNGIDTKWIKDIRKINSVLENDYNTDDLSIKSIRDWEKGVREKRSLTLYPVEWNGKRKQYLDGSKNSFAFFKTITGTLIRKYELEKCKLCGLENPDEYHVIFECQPLAIIRSDMGFEGILQEQGLTIEASISREIIREHLGKLENECKKKLGGMFGKIFNVWSSGENEGRVPSGSTNAQDNAASRRPVT